MKEYVVLNNNGDRVYSGNIKADKIFTEDMTTKFYIKGELVAIIPITLSVIKL